MFTFDMNMHAGMWHEILKVKLLKVSVIMKIINHKKKYHENLFIFLSEISKFTKYVSCPS